jgi:hypothetical protein
MGGEQFQGLWGIGSRLEHLPKKCCHRFHLYPTLSPKKGERMGHGSLLEERKCLNPERASG